MTGREDEPGDRGGAEADELAWREIVDHYGERPDAVELAALTTPVEGPEVEPTESVQEPFRFELEDETFIPPPLPPPAVISPERRLAWIGLVLSPILLILIQIVDYALPGILSFLLVVAFLASFGYLVATMSPRDPDDDGARV